MNHRVNSAIHLVSAFYWAVGTALGALFSAVPFYSLLGFRVFVSTGIGLLGVDLLAAVKQWRSPAAGRILSVVLHFAVTILIISLMTFEYLQAKPKPFFTWFRTDNYWFVAALALVRLWIGTALLLGNEDTR
jgi:predicted membrane channel-forming protein YqfA (hemolysin III family)